MQVRVCDLCKKPTNSLIIKKKNTNKGILEKKDIQYKISLAIIESRGHGVRPYVIDVCQSCLKGILSNKETR